jgi:hypothetical protein
LGAEGEVSIADGHPSALRKGVVMRKRGFVLGAVAMLFAVVVATPASAAKPLDVTFEVSVVARTFVAYGSAVNEGLMCDEGTIFNEEDPRYAGNSHVVTNARVITEFTCTEDGFDSATFVIKHQLHIDLTADPVSWTVNWVVKDGTKVFEHLRGNGHGTGDMTGVPGGPFDILVGQLH